MEKEQKAKYDMDLRKKLEKKQFNTDLNKEEYEELNSLLKEQKLTKADFLRKSMNILKERNDNMYSINKSYTVLKTNALKEKGVVFQTNSYDEAKKVLNYFNENNVKHGYANDVYEIVEHLDTNKIIDIILK